MTLVQWKPFGDLLSMQERVNRLFEDEHRRSLAGSAESLGSWYPATDIFETKDNYVFKMEVPGLTKEDIDVEFHNHVLSIKGEKKEEKEVEKENYHRIESYSGAFTRSFSLPKDADADKIEASMKDGILELRVAKAEEKKAKAISIDVK
jgi:HSP20 family protein